MFATSSKMLLLILPRFLRALAMLWLGLVCLFFNIHRGNIFLLPLIPRKHLKRQIARMKRRSGSPLSTPACLRLKALGFTISPQSCSGTGKWNSIQKFSAISVGRKKYKANALSWLLPAKRLAAVWQQSCLTVFLLWGRKGNRVVGLSIPLL